MCRACAGILRVVGAVLGLSAAALASEPVDRRSHEQVRYDCSAGELSRTVSLFANGTVRIRDTGGATPGMRLAELAPEELVAFQNRIVEIDLAEVESRVRGPSSATLEQCLLRLELESGEVREYRFARIAALPLALNRLIVVLDDLVSLVETRVRLASGLSVSYEPRVGDVLVKRDGSRFRVARVTADGGGVEIMGLEAPLVEYLAIEAVRVEFHKIESRRRPVTRREP